MRPAAEADLETLAAWIQAFEVDTGIERSQDPRGVALTKIRQGGLFVWDDRGSVSMAGWAGRTPNGARVNLVYTPPRERGRGYASACVARLSQRLLDEGCSRCFLFADPASPAVVRTYVRIGYRPVRDMTFYFFAEPRR